MKKSITKKAKPTSRKRPKSVLAKAWETRRAKKKGLFNLGAELMKQGQTASEALASLAKATPTSETATLRSEDVNQLVNGVIANHRDDALCSFLGDIAAMRMNGHMKGRYPVMVSRTQVNAIEDFLNDHGYGPWGKGSGSLMSVSTKPTVD